MRTPGQAAERQLCVAPPAQSCSPLGLGHQLLCSPCPSRPGVRSSLHPQLPLKTRWARTKDGAPSIIGPSACSHLVLPGHSPLRRKPSPLPGPAAPLKLQTDPRRCFHSPGAVFPGIRVTYKGKKPLLFFKKKKIQYKISHC